MNHRNYRGGFTSLDDEDGRPIMRAPFEGLHKHHEYEGAATHEPPPPGPTPQALVARAQEALHRLDDAVRRIRNPHAEPHTVEDYGRRVTSELQTLHDAISELRRAL